MPNPEVADKAPKKVLTPEEAQKKVDSAKGEYIELDAEISKRIIDRRNEGGGKKFKEWVHHISLAKAQIETLRKTEYKGLVAMLPKNEKDMIGKGNEKVKLTRENWKATLDGIEGVSRKVNVYMKILNATKQNPDNAYIGTIDQAVALVKGKPPLEAAEFLQERYDVRYYLANAQRFGELNQTQVNSYLAESDKNPVGLITKINEAIKAKDLEEAEKLVREWEPSADRALQVR